MLTVANNIASNTYQTISGVNSFRTTVSQTYQTISGFSSFQNQVNTAIDNMNAQSQNIPTSVLLAYVGRYYVLHINQAPSTTTWMYLGYWNESWGNPYNGTAVPEEMTFRLIEHTTKNGSATEDCYLQVIGHVSTDSFGANIECYYYSGGGVCHKCSKGNSRW